MKRFLAVLVSLAIALPVFAQHRGDRRDGPPPKHAQKKIHKRKAPPPRHAPQARHDRRDDGRAGPRHGHKKPPPRHHKRDDRRPHRR